MIRFKKAIYTLFFLVSACTLIAQYQAPMKGSILLSGSFAEPRTNHFHAGIDFKARRGHLQDTIYAIADGYISRINVQAEGYGNALYIDHGEHTSVYAHQHHFMPFIQEFMDSVMYARRKHELTYQPNISDLPVKKGQPIGILGNTGRSSGPHLHFEIRNTESQQALNPFQFNIKPPDHVPPVIKGIVVYEMSPIGQELAQKYYPVSLSSSGKYKLTKPVVSSGALIVGIGVHCYDTMDGASNHNGIYSVSMRVGGKPHFSFQLNKIDFNTSSYIHAHMDYAAKMDKKYYTKCFKNKASELSIYQLDDYLGLIDIYEYFAKEISIEVGDFDNNISTIDFAIIRDATAALVPHMELGDHLIYPTDSASIMCRPHKLSVIPHTFYQPISLTCSAEKTSILLAQNQYPTFRNIRIDLQVEEVKYEKNKYCIISTKEGKLVRYLSKWSGPNMLTAYVRDLKDYEVAIDTVRPTIKVINIANNSDYIKFEVKDNFEPVHPSEALNYELLIDGEWALCQIDAKSSTIRHNLRLAKSKTKHSLKLRVTDAAGNASEIVREFLY